MATSFSIGRVNILDSGFRQLTRSRLGPVGQDLQRRALRVTRRMKENASQRPGPHIQTRNLYEAIGFKRFGEDSLGLLADIGPGNDARMIRRGYNYALVLEGVIPRKGGGDVYPFMERSLDAAR